VTTDLRYIDAESKTAAQVLTILLTTYYLLLTSTPRVRQPRRCSLYYARACALAHSLACLLTSTTAQVTSSAVMKFKSRGWGKKAGSGPNSSFEGDGAAEAT
jgi:hypothetical protein